MSDPNRFDMEVRAQGTATELILSGVIDETTTLNVPDNLGSSIVVDGAGVKRINSLGVRSWVLFFEQLGTRGIPITVRRLSPALVIQASMISSFVRGAAIESFLVPFACDECDHEFEQLFGVRDNVPKTMPCPTCQAQAELDSEPETYLFFRSAG